MPSSIQTVFVIVVFLMPGFVASRVLSYTYPGPRQTDAGLVLTAITLSCINYAILSWLLILSWRMLWYRNTAWLAFLAILTLFVSPVLGSLGLVKLADVEWARGFRHIFGLPHPVPKAWDYFFRSGKACWVVVTLKGGRMVGGLYGSNSFASSFPSPEDLYLERLCNMTPDGQMDGLANLTDGGIIRMENVELVELFEYEAGEEPWPPNRIVEIL
jgi:hypothetical protein